MGITYKVLGQVRPPGVSTPAVLYTVPAGTSAIVSSIVVCNISNLNKGFAVAVAVAGAADTQKQYLYGSPTTGLFIDPLDTFVATAGLTLAAGDLIRVRDLGPSFGNGLAFQLFGSEIST